MTWLMAVLAAVFAVDAVRMRGRLSALAVLGDARGDGAGSGDAPSASEAAAREAGRPAAAAERDGEARAPSAPGAADDDFAVFAAPGAQVDAETVVAARAYARRHRLDAVDLVPRDLPAVRAMALAQLVDVPSYRRRRLAPGRTAGAAVAVSADLARRARAGENDVADPVRFARFAARLKRYACTGTDLAVAPRLRAPRESLAWRYAVTREVVGGATPFVLGAQFAVFAAIVAGLAMAPAWGLAALVSLHLQPVIAIAGTPVRSRDLWWVALARLPYELALWAVTVARRRPPAPGDPDPVDALRPTYGALLARGIDRFFEPRRDTCPLCGGRDLRVHLRTTDLLQQKPGRFTLERCRDCGHVFQNPRLSLEGLDFYYRDFYDGLGERGMEFIFGFHDGPYRARAEMLRGHAQPRRWLDVGGGHGHFCCAARDVWPDTAFDMLDLSDAVDDAVDRGWADRGFRGLFPELAADLAGRYDVVSMSHYLEHTRDPAAELDAARTALAPGGHLLVEVPDPESPLGRLLGRYWIPWFQPQHQHLVSRRNLDRMLRERGFEPVVWHRGEAHQRVDFVLAAFLLLDRIAPPTDRPWRPRAGAARRAWRNAVWAAGVPLVLAGRVVDALADPLVRRFGLSNTYRVLARRHP